MFKFIYSRVAATHVVRCGAVLALVSGSSSQVKLLYQTCGGVKENWFV
jgi:hypothetical protein